jgi:hypothetical protein
MAVEFPGQIISLPCVTTGVPQYRFVDVSTAGNVILTVSNGPSIGVSQTGTTGSTEDPKSISVMINGVSKLAVSTASTCGVGEIVAATSRGSAKPMAAASVPAGRIIAGTSGGAGRVVSVLFPVPASTATV